MTGAMFSAVTYVGLPIGSGGAHSLGRMSRRAAYERTMSFLQTCTEPVSASRYRFAVHDVPELARQPDLEAELELRFGQGKRVSVPADRVGEALEMLDDIHPSPRINGGWHRCGSTWSQGSGSLTRRPDRPYLARTPGDSQGRSTCGASPLGTSSLSLNIHNSASLAINLCIPDADDEWLHRIVPWLQDHLPFKMSAKHWRSWTPTKTGSFKSRRMAPPDAPHVYGRVASS